MFFLWRDKISQRFVHYRQKDSEKDQERIPYAVNLTNGN